jgi:hypothetical protein
MRVLVACEFSGIVRDAFIALGHDAASCDLLPSETHGPHYQRDVLDLLGTRRFDLMIAHPPCRYLNHAGVRWLYKKGRKVNGRDPDRWRRMRAAAILFNRLKEAPIKRIAVENSEMHPYAIALCGRPDQIIQPWQFGHGETKATWLQLKNLPPLEPTDIVEGREPRVHYASPGVDRWKERSRTLHGIANAMADQWGSL